MGALTAREGQVTRTGLQRVAGAAGAVKRNRRGSAVATLAAQASGDTHSRVT